MFPEMFHPIRYWLKRDLSGAPKSYTRTSRPPKYYIIDFGISRKYKSSDAPFLEPIIQGGDKSVPEHRSPWAPCDPFPTDVYYIANAIHEKVIQVQFQNLTLSWSN